MFAGILSVLAVFPCLEREREILIQAKLYIYIYIYIFDLISLFHPSFMAEQPGRHVSKNRFAIAIRPGLGT